MVHQNRTLTIMYSLIVIFIISSIIVIILAQKYKPIVAQQIKQYYLNILFCILALIMGLRDTSVGVDTFGYLVIFEDISKTPFKTLISDFVYNSQEIGFVIYVKLLSLVWNNYQFYLFVSAFLFCFLFKRFIEHSTKDFCIASVIFLSIGIYLGAFNVFRQMFAVALLANAWLFFKEKRFIPTILISLLAMTFHVSSFCFIVSYVIYALKDRKKLIKIIPVLFLLIYVFFEMLLEKLAPYLTYYNNYLDNHKVIQDANLVIILWVIEIIVSLYFIYSNKTNSSYRFVGCMCIIYVLMNAIGLKFNYVERIGLYFSPFLILLFCNLSDVIKDRTTKDILFSGLFYLRFSYIDFNLE